MTIALLSPHFCLLAAGPVDSAIACASSVVMVSLRLVGVSCEQSSKSQQCLYWEDDAGDFTCLEDTVTSFKVAFLSVQ